MMMMMFIRIAVVLVTDVGLGGDVGVIGGYEGDGDDLVVDYDYIVEVRMLTIMGINMCFQNLDGSGHNFRSSLTIA